MLIVKFERNASKFFFPLLLGESEYIHSYLCLCSLCFCLYSLFCVYVESRTLNTIVEYFRPWSASNNIVVQVTWPSRFPYVWEENFVCRRCTGVGGRGHKTTGDFHHMDNRRRITDKTWHHLLLSHGFAQGIIQDQLSWVHAQPF
jgi:hypothetical protein